ncbi:hypothetical protein Scep_029914 [Stephania cephalantha]|uniref:Uncharacterized protein n=1 Tax=Stephania cephalantha TaxID=152367 RepID=A0AAP0HCQ8_9MAGN
MNQLSNLAKNYSITVQKTVLQKGKNRDNALLKPFHAFSAKFATCFPTYSAFSRRKPPTLKPRRNLGRGLQIGLLFFQTCHTTRDSLYH